MFEFFLKDTLKLKQKNINSFSHEYTEKRAPKPVRSLDNLEKEIEDFDEIKELLKDDKCDEESVNALNNILEYMSMEGSNYGPCIQCLGVFVTMYNILQVTDQRKSAPGKADDHVATGLATSRECS